MPLVAPDEIRPKYKLACEFLIEKLGRNATGDYLEFGVSRGTSLGSMHKVLENVGLDQVRIFGFDSFEGLPDFAAREDRGIWQPVQYASSLEDTRYFLETKGVDWHRTFLAKGWFSDTLTQEIVNKYHYYESHHHD